MPGRAADQVWHGLIRGGFSTVEFPDANSLSLNAPINFYQAGILFRRNIRRVFGSTFADGRMQVHRGRGRCALRKGRGRRRWAYGRGRGRRCASRKGKMCSKGKWALRKGNMGIKGRWASRKGKMCNKELEDVHRRREDGHVQGRGRWASRKGKMGIKEGKDVH